MNEHTPGPWECRPIAGDLSSPGYGIISFGSRQHGRVGSVAVRPGENGIAEANARLIAAAPDMLEALKEIYGAIGGANGTDCFISCENEEIVRAALAKALGENHRRSPELQSFLS